MSTHNFFELFALPQNYTIDTQLLLSRYRDMQRVAHPDRHADVSPQQKRLAIQRSGLINEAYQTLTSPLLRARHLLECAGVEINMEATGGSPEFLERQMQAHERFQQLNTQNDTEGLAQMAKQLKDEQHTMQKDFASYIEQDDKQAALTEYRHMQFIERLRTQLGTNLN